MITLNTFIDRVEAKRFVNQGALRLDGEVVRGQSASVRIGAARRVGRRKWYRIVAS